MVEAYANKNNYHVNRTSISFMQEWYTQNTQTCIPNKYKKPSQTVPAKYNVSYGLPKNIKSLT